MGFATCGGVPSTEVTHTPKRGKDASSAAMWVRISLKRSILSRKVTTTAGEPKKGSHAMIRSCVPTAHWVRLHLPDDLQGTTIDAAAFGSLFYLPAL